jgi:hypothetical protein
MTDLSPAAQAVFDAVRIHWEEWPVKDQQWRIACSIRAAADQVVPSPGRYPMNDYMEGLRDAKQDVRAALLSIATELEKASDN